MYLTLDIGNTKTKFARFSEEGTLLESGFADIFPETTGCKAVGLANVTNTNPDFSSLNCPVMPIGHKVKLPFALAYQTPETLGADRLAGVAGAAFLFPETDLLVVDAGTCLKFELLKNNTYLGGSISPGLKMRYRALNTFTQRLPELEHRNFEDLLGETTETAILSGVQAGFIQEVTGRITSFLQETSSLCVVLTGGNAPFLAERLKTKIFAEPLLVHYGLYHTLRLNGY
jgi:type III pantothenate kinase